MSKNKTVRKPSHKSKPSQRKKKANPNSFIKRVVTSAMEVQEFYKDLVKVRAVRIEGDLRLRLELHLFRQMCLKLDGVLEKDVHDALLANTVATVLIRNHSVNEFKELDTIFGTIHAAKQIYQKVMTTSDYDNFKADYRELDNNVNVAMMQCMPYIENLTGSLDMRESAIARMDVNDVLKAEYEKRRPDYYKWVGQLGLDDPTRRDEGLAKFKKKESQVDKQWVEKYQPRAEELIGLVREKFNIAFGEEPKEEVDVEETDNGSKEN